MTVERGGQGPSTCLVFYYDEEIVTCGNWHISQVVRWDSEGLLTLDSIHQLDCPVLSVLIHTRNRIDQSLPSPIVPKISMADMLHTETGVLSKILKAKY